MVKEILSISFIKIMHTISYLNDLGVYPNHEGVYKIVSGALDKETLEYENCPTYGTMVSYSSKKISRLITYLIRYSFIAYKYNQKSDELFLTLSEKGKHNLIERFSKKKPVYKKTDKKTKPCFVKIG